MDAVEEVVLTVGLSQDAMGLWETLAWIWNKTLVLYNIGGGGHSLPFGREDWGLI